MQRVAPGFARKRRLSIPPPQSRHSKNVPFFNRWSAIRSDACSKVVWLWISQLVKRSASALVESASSFRKHGFTWALSRISSRVVLSITFKAASRVSISDSIWFRSFAFMVFSSFAGRVVLTPFSKCKKLDEGTKREKCWILRENFENWLSRTFGKVHAGRFRSTSVDSKV